MSCIVTGSPMFLGCACLGNPGRRLVGWSTVRYGFSPFVAAPLSGSYPPGTGQRACKLFSRRTVTITGPSSLSDPHGPQTTIIYTDTIDPLTNPINGGTTHSEIGTRPRFDFTVQHAITTNESTSHGDYFYDIGDIIGTADVHLTNEVPIDNLLAQGLAIVQAVDMNTLPVNSIWNNGTIQTGAADSSIFRKAHSYKFAGPSINNPLLNVLSFTVNAFQYLFHPSSYFTTTQAIDCVSGFGASTPLESHPLNTDTFLTVYPAAEQTETTYIQGAA